MPLDDLVEAWLAGAAPAGSVAITFDDGHIDNLTVAAPTLREAGLAASWFVTTDRLHTEYEFWWDVLERCLLSPSTPGPPEIHLDAPGGRVTLDTRDAAARLDAHWRIYHAIVGLPADARDQVVERARAWSGHPASVDPASGRMHAEEMVALSRMPGQTIGAHSVRHVLLPRRRPEVQVPRWKTAGIPSGRSWAGR